MRNLFKKITLYYCCFKYLNICNNFLNNNKYDNNNYNNNKKDQGRIMQFQVNLINSIYFFGQIKPNKIELIDPVFMDICRGCSKLIKLIEVWLSKEPFDLDE